MCPTDGIGELRRLAWSGVPEEVRPIVWQLLLVSLSRLASTDGQNYLPLPVQPRLTTLHRKRKEYSQLVDQYFGRGLASLDQQVSFPRSTGLTVDVASDRDRCTAYKTRCPTMVDHDGSAISGAHTVCLGHASSRLGIRAGDQ